MESKTFRMTIQRDGVFMSVEKDTGDWKKFKDYPHFEI